LLVVHVLNLNGNQSCVDASRALSNLILTSSEGRVDHTEAKVITDGMVEVEPEVCHNKRGRIVIFKLRIQELPYSI
jgi:hypothetical protein